MHPYDLACSIHNLLDRHIQRLGCCNLERGTSQRLKLCSIALRFRRSLLCLPGRASEFQMGHHLPGESLQGECLLFGEVTGL
jgi:hypothetical protein